MLPAIPLVVASVSRLLDKLIPDPSARIKAKEELSRLAAEGQMDLLRGQLAINKEEAAHKSLFVAGWRPAIGWVCGLGLTYNIVISPFLDIWFEMPKVDAALLYPVLMGMLGLGGMRSFEKLKGVAREN